MTGKREMGNGKPETILVKSNCVKPISFRAGVLGAGVGCSVGAAVLLAVYS